MHRCRRGRLPHPHHAADHALPPDPGPHREQQGVHPESPLYEITSKDKTYFAYNEREKEQFLQELAGQKYTIQRSKGLGENDPDMMNLTTMNPKTRRLIQVKPGDIQQAAQMFDVLLGDNLNGRKDYIAQHGSEYLDDLDVS